MTTPLARYHADEPSFDELETTEPDLRFIHADLLPDDDEEEGDPDVEAFTEAKTEPARPVDFASTLPDEPSARPSPRPSAARDEALLAFLETVRRVFGNR